MINRGNYRSWVFGDDGAKASSERCLFEARESMLEECLKALGKDASDCVADRKSADWKVAICVWMRENGLCRNAWLSRRLDMGAPGAGSNYVGQAKPGDLKAASKMRQRLSRNMRI